MGKGKGQEERGQGKLSDMENNFFKKWFKLKNRWYEQDHEKKNKKVEDILWCKGAIAEPNNPIIKIMFS